MALTTDTIPPGLQTEFAQSLRRAGAEGDAIQSAINAASKDYGAPGLSFMGLWWALYADKGQQGGIRLQWLYVQRHALTDLERRLFDQTTFTEAGVEQSDGDVFKAVMSMRVQIQADIDQLEIQVRAGQGAVVGVMTTTQPGPPPGPFCPNPNDPYYRGDPNRRWPWG